MTGDQPDARIVTHAKLVRDRIPDIIRAEGSHPVVRTLGAEEYATQLRRKLSEEQKEYLQAASAGDDDAAIEELADLLELLHALAATHGATEAELHTRQQEKRAERGGFASRVYLDAVIPGMPTDGQH